MAFAQHLKLNKIKRGPAWWSRRNKHYITAGDSSTSMIANIEQDMGCPSITSLHSNVKKSEVSEALNLVLVSFII